MVIIAIDALSGSWYDAIENFYFENELMNKAEYIEKFNQTFRCKAISSSDNVYWYMQFNDEDYTWFLLRYSL